MTREIQTVTGAISVDDLGPTLMHEHVVTGMPGWQTDSLAPGYTRREMLQIAKDRVAEMQEVGVRAMVDPCASDLGRDIEFCAEVSQATGFPIVAASGLYNEAFGGAAYWKIRAMVGQAAVDEMAEVFERELTEGVGSTGILTGIIKIATGGSGKITRYERNVFEAAARASNATGAPITTHTDDGALGTEQQALLASLGVPVHRIIIGHVCGTGDQAFHWRLVEGGTYLGFDRFGIESSVPDATRVASLLKLLQAGAASRVVVSHDTVWCWHGKPFSLDPNWTPGQFCKRIVPQLRAGGATQEQIDTLLLHNPRRYFSDEPLPALD